MEAVGTTVSDWGYYLWFQRHITERVIEDVDRVLVQVSVVLDFRENSFFWRLFFFFFSVCSSLWRKGRRLTSIYSCITDLDTVEDLIFPVRILESIVLPHLLISLLFSDPESTVVTRLGLGWKFGLDYFYGGLKDNVLHYLLN